MTREEKQIIRSLFKLKIIQSNGTEFQKLFENIMKLKYGEDFCIVRPYGNIGDRKNDGFLTSQNTYFQVYGPIDISKSINYAIAKIKVDAPEIIKNWKNVKQIKYVVNDKYQGIEPKTYLQLEKLNEEILKLNKLLSFKISTFSCHDIENVFMSLNEDDMISIVGSSYCNVSLDESIEFACLQEIINFVLNIDAPTSEEKLFPPLYNEKIDINNFSSEISNRLNIAHLNQSEIKKYFQQYGDDVESDLKDKFVAIYKEAIGVIPTNIECRGDSIYYYILEKICHKKSRGIIAASESLISYYFECCDIFESPEGTKND